MSILFSQFLYTFQSVTFILVPGLLSDEKIKKQNPWKRGWIISGSDERSVMHQLSAWIDAVSENNYLFISFIPSSNHEEMIQQNLQNLTYYKFRNIINFRCVLLKLKNYQNILPYIVISERTTLFYTFLASLINSPIGIVKKARRAKKG